MSKHPANQKIDKKCCICGNSPTVISHLLPKALALDTRGSSKNLKFGSISETGHQHLQAGFFDPDMLCDTHEKMLHPYDTYAVEFCRTFEEKSQELEDDMFRVPDVNTDLLVRFAVSVVWRFSISQARGIPPVKLGPFQDRFRDIIFYNAPCAPEPALIIRAYRSSRINIKGTFSAPAKSKNFDRRFWAFTVSGISFILKTDNRPLPGAKDLPAINGLDHIISGFKPFDGSYEFHQMRKIALNMKKPPARLHRN
jgi:hypothetical protein